MRARDLVLLVTFVLSCKKTHHGRTEPVEDNAWYRCELAPDTRKQEDKQVGFSVKCTAKVDALNMRVVGVTLYRDRDEVVVPEMAMMERTEPIAKDKTLDQRGTIDASEFRRGSTMQSALWMKVRVVMSYDDAAGETVGVAGVKITDLDALEKDQKANPRKYGAYLTAAVP